MTIFLWQRIRTTPFHCISKINVNSDRQYWLKTIITVYFPWIICFTRKNVVRIHRHTWTNSNAKLSIIDLARTFSKHFNLSKYSSFPPYLFRKHARIHRKQTHLNNGKMKKKSPFFCYSNSRVFFSLIYPIDFCCRGKWKPSWAFLSLSVSITYSKTTSERLGV